MLLSLPRLRVSPSVKQDTHTSVAQSAAQALASCGPEGELMLVETLQRASNASVRAAACVGLARVGTPAVRSLLLALRDRSSQVRNAAGKGLRQLGWKRVCAHMSKLRPSERVRRRGWSSCEVKGYCVPCAVLMCECEGAPAEWGPCSIALTEACVRARVWLWPLHRVRWHRQHHRCCEMTKRVGFL